MISLKSVTRACALLAMGACWPASAQTTIRPDCVIDFSLTAAAQTQGGLGTCGNNTSGVVQWTLWYKSTGFSALSLQVESAPDNSGNPGTWGAFAGTVVTGVNPNTATTQNSTTFTGFEPWVRVALTSKVGTGTITGQLYGCRQPGCSGGLALSVPPSGPAGGDLCGTYPDPTVCKVDGVAYPAVPSTNTVPVVTASNTVTYEAVPNAALANSATTVNGQTCTLGSSCTVTAVPSGTAGGDLSGTFPNPTVAKVDGVAYGASPSTNTVPVVTGANTVTYEAVPNAALANSATTVDGVTCTLGSSCTPVSTTLAALNATSQQSRCTGTGYNLTATFAQVVCGTTQPTVTLSTAGTYLLMFVTRVDHVGATYAANRTISVGLERSNNTPLQLTGGTASLVTNIITAVTETAEGGNMSGFALYTTANTNDTITLFALVSVLPTAGNSTVIVGNVLALRLF